MNDTVTSCWEPCGHRQKLWNQTRADFNNNLATKSQETKLLNVLSLQFLFFLATVKMWRVQAKRKKNPPKTTTENMLVVSPVHYQNTSLIVSCRTRALQNQRLQSPNSRRRAGFLAHRVCHADSEETGEHSGSEIQ